MIQNQIQNGKHTLAIENAATSSPEFIEKLEQNGVIILDKDVKIERKENAIVFLGEIKVREQIGINIPAEEVWEYEFE